MFDSPTCKKKDNTPLKSYYSEEEAYRAVEYVRKKYNDEQVIYSCSKCGFYHLSHKNRQTPCHISNCLDSNGKQKQAYETKEAAEKRAEIIFNEKNIKLKVYKCDDCKYYHLTHKID